MKFLFTVTDFDVGGITTSMKNLTDELIRRGHQVTILNLPNADSFPVSFHPDVRILPISGRALRWNIGMGDYQKAKGVRKLGLLFFGAFKKLLTRAGRWQQYIFAQLPVIDCDVAVAYRQSPECYYILSHKTTARRTVAFIHSEFDGDVSGWLPPLKDIDRIACVSDDWSGKFRAAFPALAKKVGTVYNLFDADDLIRKAGEFVPAYDDGCFNLITVSRLETPQKKIETIPYIYKEIADRLNRRIKWYIVGEGSARPLIEEAIRETHTEEDVILLGAKKNPYPYIKNADLFVLTSSWESFGMVLQEALILGTPVVTTDYPAAHEIIRDPHEGVFAEMSIDGIAGEIVKLVNDGQRYTEMKSYLKVYQYCPDRAYQQFMKLCEE